MEESDGTNWTIWILVGALAWAIFFHKDTYEGQTAEEWFNDYDEAESRYQEFRTCVEDFDSSDIETQLGYGGVFYYCE